MGACTSCCVIVWCPCVIAWCPCVIVLLMLLLPSTSLRDHADVSISRCVTLVLCHCATEWHCVTESMLNRVTVPLRHYVTVPLWRCGAAQTFWTAAQCWLSPSRAATCASSHPSRASCSPWTKVRSTHPWYTAGTRPLLPQRQCHQAR